MERLLLLKQSEIMTYLTVELRTLLIQSAGCLWHCTKSCHNLVLPLLGINHCFCHDQSCAFFLTHGKQWFWPKPLLQLRNNNEEKKHVETTADVRYQAIYQETSLQSNIIHSKIHEPTSSASVHLMGLTVAGPKKRG